MSQTVQAALRAGTLTGVRAGGVCRYGAIPYAQAPVGPLRFAPPQPPAWRGGPVGAALPAWACRLPRPPTRRFHPHGP